MRVVSPLFLILPRKTKNDRKVYINLNGYRNWHFQVSNKLKQMYCEEMMPYLYRKKLKPPISLTFTLYKGSKRKIDRSNILSITEKFFCDALTHYGCIQDDNDEYILKTTYITGGVDKEHPRVEIDIEENNKITQ